MSLLSRLGPCVGAIAAYRAIEKRMLGFGVLSVFEKFAGVAGPA